MAGLWWGNADPSSGPGADGGTRAARADRGCAPAVRCPAPAASVATAAVSGLIAGAAARQFTRARTTLDPIRPDTCLCPGHHWCQLGATRNPDVCMCTASAAPRFLCHPAQLVDSPAAGGGFVVVIDRLQIPSGRPPCLRTSGVTQDYRQRVHARWARYRPLSRLKARSRSGRRQHDRQPSTSVAVRSPPR